MTIGAELGPPPDPEDSILRYLVERNARLAPEAIAVTFENGERWTAGWTQVEMDAAAARLAALGVRRGDRVALMAPNGAPFLRAWFGTAALGAVLVPVNPALHGPLLEHVLNLTKPGLIAVDGSTRDAMAAVAGDRTLLDVAELGTDGHGVERTPALDPPLHHSDPLTIVMTSGTTGPSKGVVQRNLQVHVMGRSVCAEQGLGPDDVLLLDLQLFHSATLIAVVGCLTTRSTIALRTRPDLSRYWEIAKETSATMAYCISSAELLLARPPSPADRDHRLRVVLAAPLPPDPEKFMARFGIGRLTTTIGMSEGGVWTGIFEGTPLRGTSCGTRRRGFEIRLVDEHDFDVPEGNPGEMVLRHEWPWVICTEYLDNPAATAAAWRNGWFHTGDILSRDEDGYYYFRDRVKDSIRRRGENISTFEVEALVARHPSVAEVACVGYREDTVGDDEVKVFVVPADPGTYDDESLFLHCVREMPRHMIPRYIERIDVIPRTPPPTNRVMKDRLRDAGNSSATWDRKAAGFDGSPADLERLRREMLAGVDLGLGPS